MPKSPTLCPHAVLGKSKCSECKAEYFRLRRKAGKVLDKRVRDRVEYQKAYYAKQQKAPDYSEARSRYCRCYIHLQRTIPVTVTLSKGRAIIANLSS